MTINQVYSDWIIPVTVYEFDMPSAVYEDGILTKCHHVKTERELETYYEGDAMEYTSWQEFCSRCYEVI